MKKMSKSFEISRQGRTQASAPAPPILSRYVRPSVPPFLRPSVPQYPTIPQLNPSLPPSPPSLRAVPKGPPPHPAVTRRGRKETAASRPQTGPKEIAHGFGGAHGLEVCTAIVGQRVVRQVRCAAKETEQTRKKDGSNGSARDERSARACSVYFNPVTSRP